MLLSLLVGMVPPWRLRQPTRHGFNSIGLPGTNDNDIPSLHGCHDRWRHGLHDGNGRDDKIRDTASSHHRVFIVNVRPQPVTYRWRVGVAQADATLASKHLRCRRNATGFQAVGESGKDYGLVVAAEGVMTATTNSSGWNWRSMVTSTSANGCFGSHAAGRHANCFLTGAGLPLGSEAVHHLEGSVLAVGIETARLLHTTSFDLFEEFCQG